MPPIEYLITFTIAAAFLTVVPGIDTALVLRTAAVENARQALLAGMGIALGCIGWGIIVGAGLGALLAASQFAYAVLKWCGAIYLLYLGIGLIRSPRRILDRSAAGTGSESGPESKSESGSHAVWMRRGFLTNMLNPKVGIFYVSFLPQFIPADANAMLSSIVLASIHAGLGMIFFMIIIAATQMITHALHRPSVIQWLDRITGGIFIAFGISLMISEQR